MFKFKIITLFFCLALLNACEDKNEHLKSDTPVVNTPISAPKTTSTEKESSKHTTETTLSDESKIDEIIKTATEEASPIDPAKATATIETNLGTITLRFFPDVAPKHVENFIKLSQSKFYDGTIFHRVIPGFMIQGGDPNTKDKVNTSLYGQGGPGYNVNAEFNDKPHKRGTLSMARSRNPNSAGSQFFIVVKNSSFLNNQYTVFGEVTQGMEIVDKIVNQARDARDNPLKRIEMKVSINR